MSLSHCTDTSIAEEGIHESAADVMARQPPGDEKQLIRLNTFENHPGHGGMKPSGTGRICGCERADIL